MQHTVLQIVAERIGKVKQRSPVLVPALKFRYEMILNSKHRGYLLGEKGISLNLPFTSGMRLIYSFSIVKNTYKKRENVTIRKNSKTGVIPLSGRSVCRILRIFKQPVNTELFTANCQICNFAVKSEEMGKRKNTTPDFALPYINKV